MSDLVRDVGVGVQTKDLGYVLDRHADDVVCVLLHRSKVGQGIAFVEPKAWLQQGVGEPDVGEGGQQPFVKVIRDTSSILDLMKSITFTFALRDMYISPLTSPNMKQTVLHEMPLLGSRSSKWFMMNWIEAEKSAWLNS